MCKVFIAVACTQMPSCATLIAIGAVKLKCKLSLV